MARWHLWAQATPRAHSTASKRDTERDGIEKKTVKTENKVSDFRHRAMYTGESRETTALPASEAGDTCYRESTTNSDGNRSRLIRV
ncbi:hypothetical protein EVAR_41317_1 [Eumeta japonica]|uniref:Uncharacterized protein n=1 Tax=Eumeta variegata TaxID=151549 RepID=A0A4C1X542_EUMVA|nr:hypothetical protein EVAR_41317_1 [Eumeta japonica]